jgi:hypothetical protein
MTSRRSFLRGVGALLALPTLPSLLGKAEAAAGSAPLFIAYGTSHGGVWPDRMYPEDSTLTETTWAAGRPVRHGRMVPALRDGRAVLSPVLSADPSLLTDSVASRMNVLRGLDVPWYLGHHTGGHLGNFARNDGNGGDGLRMQAFPNPTVDEVLAWSPEFYPNLDGVTARSVAIGARGMSYGYDRPSQQAGAIVGRPALEDNQALFRRLFRPGEALGDASGLLVDRVVESYRRLRDRPQLSSVDAIRLEAHMERLYEVERRVNLQVGCGGASPAASSWTLREAPTFGRDPDAMCAWWQLQQEVLVAAMACGLTRVAVLHAHDTFSDFAGDWHQDIAHRAHLPDGVAQELLAAAHQRFFEGVFLDLVRRLDEVPTANGSLLDDALVVWSHECGAVTHESLSMPVITAGGACGGLRTGWYVDYRREEVLWPYRREEGGVLRFGDGPGLLWNQWLGTVLQALGVPRERYEVAGEGGHGRVWIAEERAEAYREAREVVSERVAVVG